MPIKRKDGELSNTNPVNIYDEENNQIGSPSKSALRGFKGLSVSTAPLEISTAPVSIQKRPVPGATLLIDEKKRIKANHQRVYFAGLGTTIIILLVLIIISLEGLKTEEEMQGFSYPKRLEDYGFKASQLRATVKQLFLDGALNLTVLLANESSVASSNFNSIIESSLERCSDEWEDFKLEGACHGLNIHSQFPAFQKIKEVKSPTFCKALCCELGQKCFTWQYSIKNYPSPKPSENTCLLGGPARYENENSASQIWCEKSTPLKWRGRSIKSRTVNNNTDPRTRVRSTFGKEYSCEWGQELPSPCSGLGAERTIMFYRNKSDPVGSLQRLSRKQCAASCCATVGCTHWQELPEKGCFHNDVKRPAEKIKCEDYQTTYIGGIKKKQPMEKLPTDYLVKNSSVIILDKKRFI